MYLLSDEASAMFPPVEYASPEGLLAIGGDLSNTRLLDAYRNGIFPWYSAGQPILWWSPDPRAVLYLDNFKQSRSLRKTIRRNVYQVRFDTAFATVIERCAMPRPGTETGNGGTWITPEMKAAYVSLHKTGYAHSVESWFEGRLVGGLYGVALGRGFFGESMFHHKRDASKVALSGLVGYLRQRGFHFVDCQLSSPHIMSLGAMEVPRDKFLAELRSALNYPDEPGLWTN